jgi:hypothetical protein
VQTDTPPPDDGREDLAPAIKPSRDYSQRPQKAIKLKPDIAKERPSPITRMGPPREQLAGKSSPTESPLVEPPSAPANATLPREAQRALMAAAESAGLSPREWVARATDALNAPTDTGEPPVSYDEVIIYALREMNQRLGALEERRGWLSRLWRRR